MPQSVALAPVGLRVLEAQASKGTLTLAGGELPAAVCLCLPQLLTGSDAEGAVGEPLLSEQDGRTPARRLVTGGL